MIGAHAIIYSANAQADRAFLRDVLEFPKLDVGGALGDYEALHERPDSGA